MGRRESNTGRIAELATIPHSSESVLGLSAWGMKGGPLPGGTRCPRAGSSVTFPVMSEEDRQEVRGMCHAFTSGSFC